MIQDRIEFYENFNSPMDHKSNKGNPTCATKKKSTTPQEEASQSRMKKMLLEFTEIKRPHSKQKMSSKEQSEIAGKKLSKTRPKIKGNKSQVSQGKSSSSKQKSDALNSCSAGEEQEVDIVQKVEELGDRLRRQRLKSDRLLSGSSSISGDDNDVISNNCADEKNMFDVQIELTNLEKVFNDFSESCEVLSDEIFDHAKSEHEVEQKNDAGKKQDFVEETEAVGPFEENVTVSSQEMLPSSIVDKEIEVTEEVKSEAQYNSSYLSAVNEEDDFGLNDFDENSDDNYIVEAYNQEDKWLLFTFFEINRKSYKSDSEEAQNDQDSADMVVQETQNSIEVIKNLDSQDLHNSPTSENIGENGSLSGNSVDSPWHVEALDSLGSHSPNIVENKEGKSSVSSDIWFESPTNSVKSSISGTPTSLVNFENVFDVQGNVRIQRVGSMSKPVGPNGYRSKLSYIVEEFVKSEETYLTGLHKIIKDYKPYVEQHCPPNLMGKSSYLFGNIESIHEQSVKFLELLKQTNDYEGISNAIIISASMFELYPKYSKNKPRADFFLKEFDSVIKVRQQELGDRLDLASYLLTPIQRLGKYILMLENIQKELIKNKTPSTTVKRALEIIKTEMKKGNDSIAIDSIKKCPFDLSLQGSFVMRETFNILKPKKFESMVFLFENIVVFTENISKNFEEFHYVASIRMNDLSIATFETEPFIFHLFDYPKAKRGYADRFTFVLEAKTSKIKHAWTKSIEDRLWEQLEKVKNLQKQMHKDQGKRFSRVDLGSMKLSKNKSSQNRSTRSLGRQSSVFYVPN